MLKKFYEQILAEGIDQSGEELVAMKGIDRLVNGEFRREGGITRRKGFSPPTNPTVSSAEPGKAGHTLVANGGALAVVRRLDTVNIDGAVNDGPNEDLRGFALPGTVETCSQLRDSSGFCNANVAVARFNGTLLACVVGQLSGAEDGNTTWRASVVEADTGVLLSSVESVGQRPVPIASTSGSDVRFHVVYRLNGATNIFVKAWESTTNTWTSGTSLLDGATPNASTYPAVCADPANAARFFVVFADTSTTTIRIRHVNFNHSIQTSYAISAITDAQLVAVCPSLRPLGLLHIAYALIGSGTVRIIGFLPGTGSTAELPMLTATASHNWRHLGIADWGDISGAGTTYGVTAVGCETTGTFTFGNVHKRSATYTLSGGLPVYTASAEVVDKNLYLLAEPALLQPDDLAQTALDQAAAPALFMSRVTDVPGTASRLTTTHSFLHVLGLGRYLDSAVGGGLGAAMLAGSAYNGAADDTNATYELHRLSRVVYDQTSHSYFVAALDLEEAPATGTKTYGIRVLRYCFSSFRADAQPLPRAQFGNLAYIGGNLLRCYDGHAVFEAGPFHPPQAPVVAETTGGSLTLLGTYVVQAVLLFEDAKGLVHRSAPSPTASFTLTGSNNALTLQFDLDVLPTSRPSVPVRLEVYRSESDGTTLQFDQSVDVLEGSGTVTVTVSQPDATTTANKAIYVTGDVVPAEPPPPSRALAAVGNRLFGISSVDPRTIFFSKELEEGYAAEFNAVLQFRVEASASEPVALGVLGDLLVIFTRDEAWAVSTHGGPDSTGAGTFGLPERLASDCGASCPEAAVSTPFGILVHSTSGFKLLASGGGTDVPAVVDIAGPGTTIVRSLHVPERNEAWYIVRSDATVNRIVVFSYARGKIRWVTYEVADNSVTLSMRDMVNVRGVPWLLVESGSSGANTYALRRLSSTLYVDGASMRPEVRVRTRWFKPEGHLGDSRFWKLHVFGTYGTADELRASVYVMDTAGTPADDLDSTDFLVGSFVWSTVKLALDDRLIHVRERLRKQRGAAVRVELVLPAVSGSTTARGPILHAVGWDYGVSGQPASRGATQGGLEP